MLVFRPGQLAELCRKRLEPRLSQRGLDVDRQAAAPVGNRIGPGELLGNRSGRVLREHALRGLDHPGDVSDPAAEAKGRVLATCSHSPDLDTAQCAETD